MMSPKIIAKAYGLLSPTEFTAFAIWFNTAVTLGLLLTAYEVIDTLFLEDDEEDETERSINEK